MEIGATIGLGEGEGVGVGATTGAGETDCDGCTAAQPQSSMAHNNIAIHFINSRPFHNPVFQPCKRGRCYISHSEASPSNWLPADRLATYQHRAIDLQCLS